MSNEDSSKFKVILVHPSSKHAVKLPKDISYNNLVAYVKKKVDPAKEKVNSVVRLFYKDGSLALDVVDDDDVQYFIHEVCCKNEHVQKLFISITEQPSEVKSSTASNHILPDLNVPLFPEQFHYPTPKVEQYSFHQQDYSLPHWQKNTFKNMPMPPNAPNPVIKNIHPHKNESGFYKYKEFLNKAECMFAIGKKSLIEGFEYKVIKSESTRYSVKCTKESCPWNIYTRRCKVGNKFFVSTITDVHTCSRTQIYPNHRNATMKLLSQLLLEKMKDHSRVYKVRDIQKDISLEWKIDISYKRSWGGRNLSFELLNGKPEDSFEQLPHYCHNLKLANEGTVTHIETDDAGRFKMVFIAFGVAIRSFIAFMRPLLIIDAAHLKGTYLGTNLLAVGMDGNNQIIPIATGVSQGETGESWTLFLTKLKECIGEVPDLAIISDRHQAINQACNTVFPDCFHGYCCRHLMMNCNLNQKKAKAIYWKTCKSYTPEEFQKSISELRAKRPEAVKKLEEAGFDKWSRAYCPGKRYNYLTSNSAESINSLTRHVRKVPITMLMEYYRKLLQNWYFERREKYEEAPDFELTDWAAAKVQHRMLKSANWEVRGIAMCAVYQVLDHHHSHIVDFVRNECTCRKWQLSGLPCGHVCAVCRAEGLTNCNKWAQPWFTKTNLKGTYQEMVFPLKEQSSWHNPGNLQKVLPPVMDKRQSGRPKDKNRIPSKNEDSKVKKCGRCGTKGHTREACNEPLPRKENRKTSDSGSNKGKGVMEEPISEEGRRNVELDTTGSRKRKSKSQREVKEEPKTIVDEEYFQNGRIYQDWDDLHWIGQPSREGELVWGGETSYSGINLNPTHESSNPYHLDDF